MASGSDDLVTKFHEFCTLAGSKDKCQMTSKASGKLVTDCLDKKYKSCDVKAIVDASVFPTCKEKGKPHMMVNKETCDKYVSKTAHEIAKKKTKNARLPADDAEVLKVKEDICKCICEGGPNVKVVKESTTGNVKGMTDASAYTGSHKERFDAEGKGKGAAGRVDKADNSGYVGNYRGAGSYDKKQ